MNVNLTYFKSSGKYYSNGRYTTHKQQLFEIWGEVRNMQVRKELPGLSPGHSDFIISVDVPDHPHRHPHLILVDRLC